MKRVKDFERISMKLDKQNQKNAYVACAFVLSTPAADGSLVAHAPTLQRSQEASTLLMPTAASAVCTSWYKLDFSPLRQVILFAHSHLLFSYFQLNYAELQTSIGTYHFI